MTLTNRNAYGHDMSEHLSMAVLPAQARNLVAVCACGWRSPLCKKPDAASRLWGQMHLKPMQAEVDAARCSSCFKPWAGGLCPECQGLRDVFDAAGGHLK